MSDVPKELTQRVRQGVAEQYGIELTLDEVEALRKSAYAKIRKVLTAKGIKVPDGDMEFIVWMREVFSGGRK